MRLKIGPFEINVFEPSGWAYDTDHSASGTVGLFGMVGGGIGGGRLTVKQTRPGLPNTGARYQMPFVEAHVGIGTPWPIPVSVGGGMESFPSGSFGPIFRLPGSPNASGESGPPTGFLGTYNMVSVEGTAVGGLGLTALLMGSNTVLGYDIPLSFKYFTLYWGVSLSSQAGVGATGYGGRMLDLYQRRD